MPPAPFDARTVVVLVVEDDPQTRELYRAALRVAGFTVVAVEDGLGALQYLDTHTPSAVVLDLGLPRVPGRDVLGDMAARGLTPHVPVVIVTGQPLVGLDESASACVIQKPVSPDDLVEAVWRCVRTRRVGADGPL